MIGEGVCGAIGGMKIGRGNRNTWRIPASVDPRAMVRLEELGPFKNSTNSSGFDSTTFRLVA
jgi:hypothetical protein